MKKLGFFAGAFDPIHDGHLEVSKSAVQFLELEMVYFMTEARPWGSKSPVAVEHRRTMVDISLEDEPKLEQLNIADQQFNIESTLQEIEQKFADAQLFFILGADVFIKMNSEQWPGLEKLFKHYIVVFERGSLTETDITDHARELGIVPAILPSAHPHHSSKQVRLQSVGREIWIAHKVSDYIAANKLYS